MELKPLYPILVTPEVDINSEIIYDVFEKICFVCMGIVVLIIFILAAIYG